MRICFTLTRADGSVAATGSDAAHTTDLSGWDNYRAVVHGLRAQGVGVARLDQKLVMWIESDPSVPIFPDDTIDRATEAFHDALAAHLDHAGASCSRDDWVDAPVTAIAQALLLAGWVPPLDHSAEIDEGELFDGDQRRDLGCQAGLT